MSLGNSLFFRPADSRANRQLSEASSFQGSLGQSNSGMDSGDAFRLAHQAVSSALGAMTAMRTRFSETFPKVSEGASPSAASRFAEVLSAAVATQPTRTTFGLS